MLCTLSLAGTIIPEPYVPARGGGVLQTMEFPSSRRLRN
ncbi:hypothetical protein JJ691_35190 [Kutzneria sp. CA-103260]|nr:hypothetical protein JJ691_35190 [Kutzneria sp. CA-103260]